jgi:hypothetical protein
VGSIPNSPTGNNERHDMKICIKCGRELPEEEFAKGRNT